MVRKVVLIGMRGCGKSHFGTCIAKELGWAKIDTDDEIERIEGKTTAWIINNEGWESFRNKEHDVCTKVQKLSNIVISTGGGAITFERNKKALTENALVVFLFASFKDLSKRLKGDTTRPSLTKQSHIEEEIKQVWKERKDIYFSESHIVFRAKEGLHRERRKNVEYNAKILVQKIKEHLTIS